MIKRTFYWISNHVWQVITSLAIFLFFLDLFEIQARRITLKTPINTEDLILYLIYIVVLISIGKLTEILAKTIKNQNLALEILDYKHKLSLRLAEHEDWETLIAQLAMVPGSIAAVERSVLYLRNPFSNRFELISKWDNGNEHIDSSANNCRDIENNFGPDFSFERGQSRLVDVNSSADQEEHYMIIDALQIVSGLIWFKLKASSRCRPGRRRR